MIVFANKSELPLDCIRTFGVSEKVTENPIGFFGTGLKYALAVLVREGLTVTIETGGKSYPVTKAAKKIRDGDYHIVKLGRNKLPFTTQFAKNWELWQAFRELYSNCLDEPGGVIRHFENKIFLSDFKDYQTKIIVEGEAFDALWADRGDIFIAQSDKLLLHESDKFNIYSGASNYLYYKGIRCHQLNSPSKYTYEIKTDMVLTEDRTFKEVFRFASRLETFVANFKNLPRAIVDTIIISDDDENNYESSLNFSVETFSKSFQKICAHHIAEFTPGLNDTIKAKMTRQVDDSYLDKCNVTIKPEDQQMINQGILLCDKAGFDVTKYEIKTAEFLGVRVMGLAKDNIIFITRLALMEGVHVVASALLEEFIHLEYRLADETRELETFLFNTIIRNASR